MRKTKGNGDPFAVLGVPYTASADEIKRAYRKRAMETHPDRQPPKKRAAAAERFKAVRAAYEELSDPTRLAAARAARARAEGARPNPPPPSANRPSDARHAWMATPWEIPEGSTALPALSISVGGVTVGNPTLWITPDGTTLAGPTPEEVLAVRPGFRFTRADVVWR